MIYYDTRSKKLENDKPPKSLVFLYTTKVGRFILKIITKPFFSKINGFFLSTRISKLYINRFINNNNINMKRFEDCSYCSFNDFFTRELSKKELNKTSQVFDLISPCDSMLSVYRITPDLKVNVKNSIYSLDNLVQSKVPFTYQDGYCLIFRLCPNDYHRYHAFDNMNIKNNKKIEGVLHSVNPIVYKDYMVYTENQREVSLISTDNFGEVLWIEVGALNIGKINNIDKKSFNRYEEKGYFSFGGSTIIILFQKDRIKLSNDILYYSHRGLEVRVYYGDKIGEKTK